MLKVLIRSVGREQFWSAGRRWNDKGTVVEVVDDHKIPREFLRAKYDERTGCYVVDESVLGEGAIIPMIPIRSTRAFWKKNECFVRAEDGKDYKVDTELDLPEKDSGIQQWALVKRAELTRANKITKLEYAQIRADARFLAVENPTVVELNDLVK